MPAIDRITPEQIRLVLDVSRMLAVTTELDPLLQRIAEAATSLLGCERASIWLHDARAGQLWTKVALGAAGEIRVPADSGIVGSVFQRNEILHVPDAYADRRFNPEPDRATGYRTRNLLAAPMVDIDRQPLGVIQAINKAAPFTPSDQSMLQLLADQAGVAIQRYRLQLAALEIVALRREMELARRVQDRMLPRQIPDMPGFSAHGWTCPASVTGGDCFDFWTAPDGRLGIFLADASGHGLAPTLVVSQVRSLVRSFSEVHPDPLALLERANSRLYQDLEVGRFVTAFIGFLSSDGVIEWCSAGHGPILLRNRAGGSLERINASAPPLGVLPELGPQRPEPLRLDPGGSLIIVSDGIFEAPNPRGELFGMGRVIATLQDRPDLAPEEMTQLLCGVVRGWQARDVPVDDQTVSIVCRSS